MKFWLAAALTCLGAGLVAGCAQKNVALTARPTAEELPAAGHGGDAAVASFGVEGGPTEARERLVPDFKPPELSAEERAAVGEVAQRHKFLPYNVFGPTGTRVGSWFGGIKTATSGDRGATVELDPVARKVSGVQGAGGATTGVDPAGSSTGRVQPYDKSVAKTGPEGGVRVGTDPVAKKTGARRP